jgi:hypothetical protein
MSDSLPDRPIDWEQGSPLAEARGEAGQRCMTKLAWVSEDAARAASSALAMVDTAERLLDRDLEASDDAGVAASRE